MKTRSIIIEGHRRRHNRCPTAATTKMGLGRLLMVAQLAVVLAAATLVLSTTMVSSKTPSLIPQRGRGRRVISSSSSSSNTNNNTIRHASAATSSTKSQEAPWVSGFKNSLASGLAAGCSKLLLAPFDTIKTLQQASMASATTSLSLSQATREILKRSKGFLELYVSIVFYLSKKITSFDVSFLFHCIALTDWSHFLTTIDYWNILSTACITISKK